MKTRIFLLVLLLFTVLVSAQTADVDAAYAWLVEQPVSSDVFTASLSALAINKVDVGRTQPYLDVLETEFDATNNCWPKSGCNVQDTALAIIADSEVGLNVNGLTSQQLRENVEEWFIQKQSTASLSGSWVLQIITSGSGTCDLKYQKRGEAESSVFKLEVDAGRISYGSCQDRTLFSLNSCLGRNLVDKPSTFLEVRCEGDLPGAQLSLVYLEGDTFYLITEPSNGRLSTRINNGWFGNKLDTLYADWALSKINSQANSLIYLKKNAQNKVMDNSLLYLATLDPSYLNSLVILQSNFGDFHDQDGSKEFDNGLAALALRTSGQYSTNVELVKEWLGKQQRASDGSWSGDVQATAMVLYGAFEGGNLPDAPDDSGECGDGVVNTGEDCDGSDLGGETCSSLNLGSGTLGCIAAGEVDECTYDTFDCAEEPISDCILTEPKWLNQQGAAITQAGDGSTVVLSVSGTVECSDKSISFGVFEEEGGTDREVITLGPETFSGQEGSVFVEWTAIWEDDNPLPLAEDDPEYYFMASVINENSDSGNSPLLKVLKAPCTPQWECTIWGPACSDDTITQTRACTDANSCGVACEDDATCSVERSCSDCVPSWDCTSWSSCFAGEQTRTCEDRNFCGKPCGDLEECITEKDCFLDANNDTDDDLDNLDDLDDGGDTDDSDGDTDDDVCFVNQVCEETWGENHDNCPEDCPADDTGDDAFPDLTGPGDGTTDDDLGDFEPEEEAGGSFWIIVIFILLLLVLIIIYFFVFKKPKGKKKGRPGFGLPQAPKRPALFSAKQTPPPRQVRSSKPSKSALDNELEKSLKEAKRLLKK